MLEKIGGFLIIVIAIAGLAFVSAFQPPIYVQIIGAFVGSFVCLVGVVFMFAEGRIFAKEHKDKITPEIG